MIYVDADFLGEGTGCVESGVREDTGFEKFISGVKHELCLGQAVYASFDGDWSFKMGDREDAGGRNSIVVPYDGMMIKVFIPNDLDPYTAMDMFWCS